MTLQFKNFFKVKNFVILTILFIGILLRLLVSKIGYNFDMESWDVVRYILSSKESVYSNTSRYNYGPIWSYVIFFLNLTFKPIGTQELHQILSGFMCLLDVLIFFIMYRYFNLLVGALYFLNPAVILISGYHIQIDNFAILFGLFSWIFMIKSLDKDLQIKNINFFIVSLVFLGISLSIKHIFIFFPLILGLYLVDFNYKNIIYRLKELFLLIIPYLIFFGSFLLEVAIHNNDRLKITEGILLNVFGYRSLNGNSFVFLLLSWVGYNFNLNISVITNFLIKNSFAFFISLIFLSITLVRNMLTLRNIYFFYLLIFYAFSPSLADQYLLIPVLSFIVLGYNKLSLFYLLFSSLYLFIGSGNNINLYFNIFPSFRNILIDFYFLPQLIAIFYLLNLGLKSFKFSNSTLFKYLSLTIFILINFGLAYVVLFFTY